MEHRCFTAFGTRRLQHSSDYSTFLSNKFCFFIQQTALGVHWRGSNGLVCHGGVELLPGNQTSTVEFFGFLFSCFILPVTQGPSWVVRLRSPARGFSVPGFRTAREHLPEVYTPWLYWLEHCLRILYIHIWWLGLRGVTKRNGICILDLCYPEHLCCAK
jgi:hypothetical protein